MEDYSKGDFRPQIILFFKLNRLRDFCFNYLHTTDRIYKI